jgi:hypothetical protein
LGTKGWDNQLRITGYSKVYTYIQIKCVYIYTYVFIYKYIHMYIYINIYIIIYIYYTCMHIHMRLVCYLIHMCYVT